MSNSISCNDKTSSVPEEPYAKHTYVQEYKRGQDSVRATGNQCKNVATKEVDAPKRALIVPEPVDIICGRGRGNFSHPGNQIMQSIIHRNRERYRHAPTKSEKTEISREVLATIFGNGGRFLKRKDSDIDAWEEVEYKDALKKVCHGICDNFCNGVKATF